MPDREYNPPLDEFLSTSFDPFDLRCSRDDTNAYSVAFAFAGHEPVFCVYEVIGPVNFLEGFEAFFGWKEVLWSMGTTFCELDERSLGVPSEEGRGIRGMIGSEQVEQLWI